MTLSWLKAGVEGGDYIRTESTEADLEVSTGGYLEVFLSVK